MQRLFALMLVICLWLGFAPSASADVAGLVPCGESPAFAQRLNVAVKAQEARLKKYDAKSAPAAAIQDSIAHTKKRFAGYEGLLCGSEGLPHLITDGRLDHIGEMQIPALLFLYLAGWLGWAGRTYLRAARKTEQPEMKEIQIDLPLAIQSFASALLWPLAALQETLSGDMQEQDSKITVSPR
ncbi:MAG: Photosystem I reaction center subunit III [Leptolyngbyaceae bacterium]|nr:Photosystem I reaction center subunit III [Leptolyngbyaceae bacterium]